MARSIRRAASSSGGGATSDGRSISQTSPWSRSPHQWWLGAFAPAIPDRLVRALVVGPSEDEAVLGPDDGVGPVAALLGEDPRHERQLLGAHADVDGAVDRGEQVPRPGPARTPPRRSGRGSRWRSAVAGAPRCWPPWSPRLDVVGRVGEGHRRPGPAEQPLDVLGAWWRRRHRSRWSPSAQRSPGLVRGARAASSRAVVEIEVLRLARASRGSRGDRSRSLISSSPKPESERSTFGLACRSASSRARSCSSQEPEIRLRARLSRRACSIDEVEVGDRDGGQPEPSGREQALVAADDGAVLPAGEDRLDEAELAQAALEGVELVLAIRRGLAGSGRSSSMATCSTVRDGGTWRSCRSDLRRREPLITALDRELVGCYRASDTLRARQLLSVKWSPGGHPGLARRRSDSRSDSQSTAALLPRDVRGAIRDGHPPTGSRKRTRSPRPATPRPPATALADSGEGLPGLPLEDVAQRHV